MENINNLVGYFEDNSNTPTHDPGIDVPCILCFKPLDYPNKQIVTSSFSAFFDGADKSYFYRAHRDCYNYAESVSDSKGDSDISNLEASIMKELGSIQDFNTPGLFIRDN